MPRDQRVHPPNRISPNLAGEMGSNILHAPVASAFDAVFPPLAKPLPFNGIEFQPSEVCPRNFIIFDQTHDRSQVMYHPTLTRKLNSPALNIFAAGFPNNHSLADLDNLEKETSSSLQEDSDEINALLSLEEEEEEQKECDEEEEVSTAHTLGHYGRNSPVSCSSSGWNNSRQNGLSSSVSSCNKGEKKRLKMKKMMKVLRGIVPGGEQMNTASVLDEAVRYLKSLKVEAQKFGVGNREH